MSRKVYEKRLTASEIKHKFIVIRKEADSIFPEPGIPFNIKDGDKTYTVSRDAYNRIFRYMSSWYRDHPELKPGDKVEFWESSEEDIDFLISVKISQKRLQEKEKKLQEKEEEDYDFNHNEIVDKIRDIGSWLGFESEKGVNVAPRASVDVLWKVKIGNLGEIKYVFHRSSVKPSMVPLAGPG
jgi:bifunctional DNA-binding transcriptional regulator/antitoxin component of YhaV-PrlF toxin-antitoxin module